MAKKASRLAKLKKQLLILNNKLPQEIGKLWVTSNELHERLIHAGVHPSLRFEIVQDAIKRLNGDGAFLATRLYLDIQYYRSQTCHLEADPRDIPSSQRFKIKSTGVKNRININPERDYFKTFEGNLLATINRAIETIIKEEKSKCKSILSARSSHLTELHRCPGSNSRKKRVSNTERI